MRPVLHISDQFVSCANQWVSNGLGVIAISANDPAIVAQDGPDEMATFAVENRFRFPYLFDERQVVVKQFKAVCTPEFYLYNGKRRLVYRGQFDGSRLGDPQPVNGADLTRAVDALLAEEAIDERQIPSVGCSIKWRAGCEPDYA